jgi:hypothetical protein
MQCAAVCGAVCWRFIMGLLEVIFCARVHVRVCVCVHVRVCVCVCVCVCALH